MCFRNIHLACIERCLLMQQGQGGTHYLPGARTSQESQAIRVQRQLQGKASARVLILVQGFAQLQMHHMRGRCGWRSLGEPGSQESTQPMSCIRHAQPDAVSMLEIVHVAEVAGARQTQKHHSNQVIGTPGACSFQMLLACCTALIVVRNPLYMLNCLAMESHQTMPHECDSSKQ